VLPLHIADSDNIAKLHGPLANAQPLPTHANATDEGAIVLCVGAAGNRRETVRGEPRGTGQAGRGFDKVAAIERWWMIVAAGHGWFLRRKGRLRWVGSGRERDLPAVTDSNNARRRRPAMATVKILGRLRILHVWGACLPEELSDEAC
jgi:hypothetical protein